ncbi:hypothetical protein [Spongiactinospora gelatinilytica]|uniref:hypothetical protein n=1 Tax=Spongiactinospora gelatinilytica TaxID=2666298 RepID=UPI001314FA75|nr:hypothetical protein [Spongiactinospora gelatinilytica]
MTVPTFDSPVPRAPRGALKAVADTAPHLRGRGLPGAPPVQSYLFAHTPLVVVYDCPGR